MAYVIGTVTKLPNALIMVGVNHLSQTQKLIALCLYNSTDPKCQRNMHNLEFLPVSNFAYVHDIIAGRS